MTVLIIFRLIYLVCLYFITYFILITNFVSLLIDSGGRWSRGGSFRGRGGRGRGRGRGRGSRGGNRGGGGDREYHPRTRFDDEDNEGDASMGGRGSGRERYNPYGSRGGGSGSGSNRRERSPTSNSGWWKVILPNMSTQSREWLLNQLKQACPVPFEEKNCHNAKESVCFFVDDENAAKELRKLNNTITTRDGKIGIITKPSDPPRERDSGRDNGGPSYRSTRPGGYSSRDNHSGGPPKARNFGETETDPKKLDVFKEFLSQRFIMESIKLDLTNIHGDKTLRSGDIDTRIWQPKLMNTILMLVHELCPNLKCLDISNNRLQRLDILANLREKCPNLEELNLSNNQIQHLDELSKISDCKSISKLWINDNPAKDSYENDDSGYVSAIRTRLVDIKELDGVVLPPPITFDLVDDKKVLPKSLPQFFCDDAAKTPIAAFLKSFFKLYDSKNTNDREELLDVYHKDAVFSVVSHNTVFTKTKPKVLNDYNNVSRNLITLKDPNKKVNLIKHKKLVLVALLTELPATNHLLESFKLDVTLAIPSMVMFTVHGVFLEGKDMTPRSFTRIFVTVPQSNGKLAIINDQLFVRQATDAQTSDPKLASVINGSNGFSAAPLATTSNIGSGLSADQQEKLQRFSSQSTMNLKYSLDCLVSSGWNFEVAAATFTKLKENNQLPAEAFS